MFMTPNVKLLVMDVDGTLTDGTIYTSNEGELCKAFYVRDGHAIKHFLPSASIQSAIITGRKSLIVENRAKELGIQHCFQGVGEKDIILGHLKEQLGVQWSEIAYIGDDVNDLSAMRLLQSHCGLIGCPADAVKEVQDIADFISAYPGGRGAVREFIEWLLERSQ